MAIPEHPAAMARRPSPSRRSKVPFAANPIDVNGRVSLTRHVELQASSDVEFPSSHSSLLLRTPSPHLPWSGSSTSPAHNGPGSSGPEPPAPPSGSGGGSGAPPSPPVGTRGRGRPIAVPPPVVALPPVVPLLSPAS